MQNKLNICEIKKPRTRDSLNSICSNTAIQRRHKDSIYPKKKSGKISVVITFFSNFKIEKIDLKCNFTSYAFLHYMIYRASYAIIVTL